MGTSSNPIVAFLIGCFLPSEVTIHGCCRCRHLRSPLRSSAAACSARHPALHHPGPAPISLRGGRETWRTLKSLPAAAVSPVPRRLPRAACSLFPPGCVLRAAAGAGMRGGLGKARSETGRLWAVGVSSASRHRCCICSHNSSASPSAFCPEKLGRTSPNPPPRTAAAAPPGARGRGSGRVPPGVQRRRGWRAPAVDLGGVGSRMRPAAPFGLCLVQARRRWMAVPSRVCRGRRCPLQEGASRHHGDFIRGVCSRSPLHPSGSRGAAGRGPGMAMHPLAQARHQAVAGREAAQSAFKLGDI